MEWDGVERRTGAVTREEFAAYAAHSDKQRHELRDLLREVRSSVVETQRSLKCVHSTWEDHIKEYGPLFRDAKATQQIREQLRLAVMEKSSIGIVWALLVLLGYALWDYLKSHLR